MSGSINGCRVILAYLVITAVTGCASLSQKQHPSHQALAVDNAVYDFQYAGPTQIIEHEFKLSNKSRSPISIRGLSVCCGCEAQPSIPLNSPISPGQSSSLLVTCTMPRYEGVVEKVITLQAGPPGPDEIALIMKGKVRRGIVVTPASLFLGTLKKGETTEQRLRVLQMTSEQLNIKKVEADPKCYTTEVVRFDERNHRGYEVTVRFSGKAAAGTYSDVITIHTTDDRQSKIDVPVVAKIVE